MIQQKWTLTFPRGSRDSIMREIKNFSFLNGIKCEVDEDRRFWISDYRMTLEGKEETVRAIEDYINRIKKTLEEEDE